MPTDLQPTLPVSKIYVPPNIRRPGWEKNLDKLMYSIEKAGLKQPPGVIAYTGDKKGPNGETHELVFGQRRLEACKRLKWTTIPVVLLSSKSSGKDIFVSKLVENFEREDLSPLEEAEAFRQAISELGFTAKALAKRIGKTDGYVSQRLGLLKLPDKVRKAVQKQEITPTHARELARVTDAKQQERLLQEAKRLPLAEFKERIDALDAQDKKHTKRGRKPRKENNLVPEIKMPPSAAVAEALGVLDEKKKAAGDKNDKIGEAYLRGMIRGIGWARGLGVKDLLPA